MIFEVGRVCMKIAGRDANKYCTVVKVVDKNTVEIEGQTRRRKCATNHLEPIDVVLKIKADASNKEVADALTAAGFKTAESKPKEAKKVVKQTTAKKVVKKAAKAE